MNQIFWKSRNQLIHSIASQSISAEFDSLWTPTALFYQIMSDLPEVEDRALSRVPVELWRDIFDFVTSVPRKYEFTMDGAAYVMANEASRVETGIPTSKEASEITRSRFSIIRVCKHWYAIGIRAHWSHLRIGLYAEPIRKIERIQEAISRDTQLASYVIRITLEESRTKPS
jgi:hypothetical protein